MGLFQNVTSRLSKSGRNLKKKEYAQQKRQAIHQIRSIREAIAQRKIDDPREQARLKQGMFGRGLGKSTIMDQEKSRLDLMQSNRNAALSRSLMIAYKNYSLIKKRWKYGRRTQWAQSVDDLLSVVGGVAGLSFGGSADPNMGGGGGGAEFSGPDSNSQLGPNYYGGGSAYA